MKWNKVSYDKKNIFGDMLHGPKIEKKWYLCSMNDGSTVPGYWDTSIGHQAFWNGSGDETIGLNREKQSTQEFVIAWAELPKYKK